MVVHIQTFFNALLGVALPEVVCVIFALALAFLVLRSFFSIFGLNTKILDFTFYVSVGFIAISSLGGLEWSFLLS